jgi:hypothetical protein
MKLFYLMVQTGWFRKESFVVIRGWQSQTRLGKPIEFNHRRSCKADLPAFNRQNLATFLRQRFSS